MSWQTTRVDGSIKTQPDVDVLSEVLTGLDVGLTGVISASDTILQAFGRLQYQVSNIDLSGYATTSDLSSAVSSLMTSIGTVSTNLSTHAALTAGAHGMTAFGASLVDDANAAAARATLGLGTAATQAECVLRAGDTMTGALAIGNGTIVASAPVLDLSQTWNNASIVFTGFKVNVTNTLSASLSSVADFQVGGSSRFRIDKLSGSAGLEIVASPVFGNPGIRQVPASVDTSNSGWIQFNNNIYLGRGNFCTALFDQGQCGIFNSYPFIFSSTNNFFASTDPRLVFDGAGILAQRNSTNAQEFRIYSSYTDASNYSRFGIRFLSGYTRLETQIAGTGTTNGFLFSSTGDVAFQVGANIYLQTNGGTTRWQMNSSGHFLAGTDNTYDIGASGATRPRNLYVAGDIKMATGGIINDGGGVGIYFGNNASNPGFYLGSARIQTGTHIFQFGGTTASFPALKRSTTILQGRLADDSDYCGIQGKHYTHANAVTETIVPDKTLLLYDAAGTAYKVPCVAA